MSKWGLHFKMEGLNNKRVIALAIRFETKIKEIGVRKVLGASTQSIWMIISNRFLILIGIAFCIALPLSYWLMNGWLEEFVYRTNISVVTILLPMIATALLTLAAISYQTLKATKVNPVECLKDE